MTVDNLARVKTVVVGEAGLAVGAVRIADKVM